MSSFQDILNTDPNANTGPTAANAASLSQIDAGNMAPGTGGGGDNSDLIGQIQDLSAQVDQAQQQYDALLAEWNSLNGTGAGGGTGAGTYTPPPSGGSGGPPGGYVQPGGTAGNLPANYQLGTAELFNNGDLRRFGFGGPPPQNMYPVGSGSVGLSNYTPPPMPSFTPPYRNSAQDAQPIQGPPNPLVPAP